MEELLLKLVAMGLMCFAGLAAGVFGMAILFVLTGNSTWQRLRRRSRPLLWNFGMDWPEIKRTWKRSFMTYYGRGLPDLTQQVLPSDLSDEGLLDESGDVPPATLPPMSSPTVTP